MKKFVIPVFFFLLGVFFILLVNNFSPKPLPKIIKPTPIPTPLAAYKLDSLSASQYKSGNFSNVVSIKDEKEFTGKTFSFSFSPDPSKNDEKQTSGLINEPKTDAKTPVIVMIRGYVDQKAYQTGVGSRPAGEFFAKNGFLTIAPDFLGYANSDSEAGNIFESRFQTYTTVLSILQSINTPSFAEATDNKWDGKHIFIWAHSNGGQIALTVLSVTGGTYPTVLWAPVSKPFPYSVLYYTDESDDGGKLIRHELSDFEDLYNVNDFSFTNYIDHIHGILQIHQGTADDAVPVRWTQSLVSTLKKNNVAVNYYQYPGADHNLRPVWDEVTARDLEFYKKNSLE